VGDEEVGGCSCEKAGSGYLEKFEIFCVTQGEGESEISPSSEPAILPPNALSWGAIGIQSFTTQRELIFLTHQPAPFLGVVRRGAMEAIADGVSDILSPLKTGHSLMLYS